METQRDIDDAYADGAEARAEDLGKESNPFTPGCDLYEAWQNGWIDEDSEHKGRP